MRIVRIEGIALLLLVSSTGHAGLPAHLADDPSGRPMLLVPRLRACEALRPATPAVVDLALFELVARAERSVEALATVELPALLVAIAASSDVARSDAAGAAQPLPRAAQPSGEALVFVSTQQGPFDDLILRSALRFRVDPFLLKGVLANESKLDPLRSGKRHYALVGGQRRLVAGGAVGIAQFSGGGARGVLALRRARQRRGELTTGFDLERAAVPQEAVPAAAELLAHLIRRYGRDGGITAYNSGVAGGLAVARLGFWNARSAGKLQRSGIFHIQGHRFLLNVLRETNRYRAAAGLTPMQEPPRPRQRAATQLPVL